MCAELARIGHKIERRPPKLNTSIRTISLWTHQKFSDGVDIVVDEYQEHGHDSYSGKDPIVAVGSEEFQINYLKLIKIHERLLKIVAAL